MHPAHRNLLLACTLSVACLASMHKIPFYVAAPWSTVDLETPDGARAYVLSTTGEVAVLDVDSAHNVTDSGSTFQPTRGIFSSPWPTGGEAECDYLSAHSKKSSTRST